MTVEFLPFSLINLLQLYNECVFTAHSLGFYAPRQARHEIGGGWWRTSAGLNACKSWQEWELSIWMEACTEPHGQLCSQQLLLEMSYFVLLLTRNPVFKEDVCAAVSLWEHPALPGYTDRLLLTKPGFPKFCLWKNEVNDCIPVLNVGIFFKWLLK